MYDKNLNTKISNDKLKEIFTKFKNVTNGVVMVDEESKISKQFWFVCYYHIFLVDQFLIYTQMGKPP